jgi:hypothetical protein
VRTLRVSARMVTDWIQKKKIPYHRLAWKSIRVSVQEVLQQTLVRAETPLSLVPKMLKKDLPTNLEYDGKEAVLSNA